MEINKVVPSISSPGGTIIIHGKNFDPWNLNTDYIKIDGKKVCIDAMSESKIFTQLPLDCEKTDIEIKMYANDHDSGNPNFISFHYKVLKPLLNTHKMKIINSPVIDNEGNSYFIVSSSDEEKKEGAVYKINKDLSSISLCIDKILDPSGLLVDNKKRLFITSQSHGQIFLFDTKTDSLKVFSQGLGNISALVMNPLNIIFVADSKGNLYKLEKDGRAFFHHSIPESNMGVFMYANDQKTLYFTTPNYMGENHIYSFDLHEKKLKKIYSSLNFIFGFTLDSKKNIFLIEDGRNGSTLIKISPHKKKTIILTGIDFIGLVFRKNGDLLISSYLGLYLIEKKYLY